MNLVTTRFLATDEYSRVQDFLCAMSSDSRAIYFGTPVSDEYIAGLCARVAADPNHHQYFVAEIENEIVGMIHVAVIDTRSVELAIAVSERMRRQGIGDRLMREVLVWARNRLFTNIYLHCLQRNIAVRRLCERHNLSVHSEEGDSEAEAHLPPPSFYTIFKETEKNVSDLAIMSLQLFTPKSKEKVR